LTKDLKIARVSNSDWAAPILVVDQPLHLSQPMRLVMDYRRLNSQTMKVAFCLPLIESCVNNLSGSQLFTTIDLKSAYWQIPMKESSIKYTAFSSPFGNYEFTRVPFGLTNAPACMQKITNHVVDKVRAKLFADGTLEDIAVEGYIDDFVIGTQNHDHMVTACDYLLTELEEAGLKISLDKCHFEKQEIKFLGFIIDKHGKRPDPAKLEAVQDMPIPKNITALRSFLGLCNYYRRYIPSFASRVRNMTALTKNDTEFNFIK